MSRLAAFAIAFLRMVAFALAGVGAAAALGAQLGRFSNDFDALTHFAPYWLCLGLAGAGLWAATGGRRLRSPTPIAALVAVLLTGGLMLPEYVRLRGPAAPADGETLKLIQFNLWGRTSDPAGLIAWVRRQNADVLVFEEAFGEAGGIAGALANSYPHQVTCADPAPCPTLILSRRQPSKRGALDAGQSTAAMATWTSPRGDFTIIGAHYVWPLPSGPQQETTRHLARALDAVDRRSAIVAGDFNSTPWSFALKRQDRLFGLERRTRALPSWPAARFSRYQAGAAFPFLPIDHVYAGSDWKTVSVERGPRLGSDHYPVVVVLKR